MPLISNAAIILLRWNKVIFNELNLGKNEVEVTSSFSTVACQHQIGLQYACSERSIRCRHIEHIKQCQC